jgi:hypothetical protein
MTRKKRPALGATIGGILVGFDQQVFKTVPPAVESVHHARPDAPVPTKDGGLVVILPPEPRDAEAPDVREGPDSSE